MRGLRRTALLLCAAAAAHAAEEKSPFVDPQDGWFDLSNFLDQAYGAVPVVAPVTEPAVGYGAAGALSFIDRDPKAKAGMRADLYAIGGVYNAAESWAAVRCHVGNCL